MDKFIIKRTRDLTLYEWDAFIKLFNDFVEELKKENIPHTSASVYDIDKESIEAVAKEEGLLYTHVEYEVFFDRDTISKEQYSRAKEICIVKFLNNHLGIIVFIGDLIVLHGDNTVKTFSCKINAKRKIEEIYYFSIKKLRTCTEISWGNYLDKFNNFIEKMKRDGLDFFPYNITNDYSARTNISNSEITEEQFAKYKSLFLDEFKNSKSVIIFSAGREML